MSEQQVQAAAAVYAQLVAAREELTRLQAIRPLLSGVVLSAGPGVVPVRVTGLQAQRLSAAADVAEDALRGRVADLEAKLDEL